jgi:uncharacterized protein (DUF433 family)
VKLTDALWQDKDRMSGTPCFRGTRVPVRIVFEYLEAGRMDEFYAGFPNVSREQVSAVLQASKELIEESFDQAA